MKLKLIIILYLIVHYLMQFTLILVRLCFGIIFKRNLLFHHFYYIKLSELNQFHYQLYFYFRPNELLIVQ
jgi:hypothetical protein